ncbi:hypothetical protein CLV90_2805 [Maribacter spongiicola]|uniref:Uncharacterized protein n=1 Tax=Maribacter spongiicola TaxID=1206753 RepID=A0A4R7K1B0_9FLAO|nr:hypothetical protein [Maribacter spongiicola]TDT43683.1 hypothetical protein CLV90_2805 [Maribacter spongiicola]
MKIKLVSMLALSIVLTSCSSTKKTGAKNSKDSMAAQETNNTSSTTAAMDNRSTTLNNNTSTAVKTLKSKNEYASMFSSLEMTDEQIRKFSVAMDQFKSKQANMASGEMLGSVESERTRQLESILSSSQLSKYEKWLVDNQ